MISQQFWHGKKVLITGHTGFKGTWLTMWLQQLGAMITGYSLSPDQQPNMYEILKMDRQVDSRIADIRDSTSLFQVMHEVKPEIVFHLAAQPLVRFSYEQPVETFDVNVMGTVNILEAIRKSPSVRVFINITTDKVYRNREWTWGYREVDELGGKDPYSTSKVLSEMVTESFYHSFFETQADRQCHMATARAGNVIGGGDWAADRLVPDCIRALANGAEILLRYPHSVRPWQHVLEPLSGYLLLAEQLFHSTNPPLSHWNFGPNPSDVHSVEWMVQKLLGIWGDVPAYRVSEQPNWPESHLLQLDSTKAQLRLKWNSIWDASKSIEKTVDWYKRYLTKEDMAAFTVKQIMDYQNDQVEKYTWR